MKDTLKHHQQQQGETKHTMHLCLTAVLVIITPLLHLFSSSSLSPSLLVPLAFILGTLFPSFLSTLTSRLVNRVDSTPHPRRTNRDCLHDKRLSDDTGSSSTLYGLDHAILNVPSLVADSMWMNMGYWKVSTTLRWTFTGYIRLQLRSLD